MKLVKNMGAMDRVIRFFIVLMILALWGVDVISGIVAIILLTIAGIFLFTSFTSFCPIYFAAGLNSLEKGEGKKKKRKG